MELKETFALSPDQKTCLFIDKISSYPSDATVSLQLSATCQHLPLLCLFFILSLVLGETFIN